jgi:hypothetical protein
MPGDARQGPVVVNGEMSDTGLFVPPMSTAMMFFMVLLPFGAMRPAGSNPGLCATQRTNSCTTFQAPFLPALQASTPLNLSSISFSPGRVEGIVEGRSGAGTL